MSTASPGGRGEKVATLDDVMQRLDAILLMLLEAIPNRDGSKRTSEDVAVHLSRSGLRPMQIARLTGRHAKNISRDISRSKKTGRLHRS